METFMFYRKVAARMGWGYVILNFWKLGTALDVIREASDKFGVKYQYDAWIRHNHLAVSISTVYVITTDYQNGIGKNYQFLLRKIFGAL